MLRISFKLVGSKSQLLSNFFLKAPLNTCAEMKHFQKNPKPWWILSCPMWPMWNNNAENISTRCNMQRGKGEKNTWKCYQLKMRKTLFFGFTPSTTTKGVMISITQRRWWTATMSPWIASWWKDSRWTEEQRWEESEQTESTSRAMSCKITISFGKFFFYPALFWVFFLEFFK